MSYPEHDRLMAVKAESQAIGEFIEHAGYTLCTHREAGSNGEPEYLWKEGHGDGVDEPPNMHDFLRDRAVENPAWDAWGSGYVAVGKPINAILADYFDIDLDKIEAEKRAMLDALRELQTGGGS